MQHAIIILGASFLFALVGLLAAWGAVTYAPSGQNLTMLFLLTPCGGAIFGWFAGYMAVPLSRHK